MRHPVWMAGEQAVGYPDLVRDEQSKREADPAGSCGEVARQRFGSSACVGDGRAERHGDHHHPCNSPQAEDEQVRNSPMRIVNGSQHQQSDRRRAGKPVNNADEQWTAHLINGQGAAEAIENSQREPMRVLTAGVGFTCYMGVRSVWMIVLMHTFFERSPESEDIERAKKDEHETDRELHRQAKSRRDDKAKDDDCGSNCEDGQSVSGSPKRANEGGVYDTALAGDDG